MKLLLGELVERSVTKKNSFRHLVEECEKNGGFSVKNEKLFERSEFFSFRKILHFLALEREPARTKEKTTLPQDYEVPYLHAV